MADPSALPVLPLVVVVVGEFGARDLATGASDPFPSRLVVDRDNFGDVLRAIGPRPRVAIPDVLGGGAEPLVVTLDLTAPAAFEPAALAAQLPSARALLDVRDALVAYGAGRGTADDLAAAVERARPAADLAALVAAVSAPAVPPPAPAPDTAAAAAPPRSAIDGILDGLVPVPDGAAAGADAGDAVRALLRDVLATGRPARRLDPAALERAVAALDAALSAQVDPLLHHPEVARLEAAWRGLRFLLDRADPRAGVRVELVSTGRETLLGMFDDLVYEPERAGVSGEPAGLVVLDVAFDGTPADLELLNALGRRCGVLSAPLVASATPALLGGDAARLARGTLPEPADGAFFTGWRGLREDGASRWLALAVNRFLLRARYAPGERDSRRYAHRESGDGVWGHGAWAVAALAAQSFARLGWCTDMTGPKAGVLGDLPVRTTGTGAQVAVEWVVPEALERDLAGLGLVPLVGALDSDRVTVRLAPLVHAPQHYQDPLDKARARLQSMLPFQLFVGRLVNYALLIEGHVVAGRGAEEIAAEYARALRGLLASAGPVPADAVAVKVLPNDDDPTTADLFLRVRWPGTQSLPGAGDIELRWPLAG